MANKRGSETRKRKQIEKLLSAETVTSVDRDGLRRFKCKKTGKWGCCTPDGEIIVHPVYDEISFFCPVTEIRTTVRNSKTVLFNNNWQKVDPASIHQ